MYSYVLQVDREMSLNEFILQVRKISLVVLRDLERLLCAIVIISRIFIIFLLATLIWLAGVCAIVEFYSSVLRTNLNCAELRREG